MPAALGAAFTAAHRVAHRVLSNAALVRLLAHPSLAAGLAEADVHVVRVRDRADTGTANSGHAADFAARQGQLSPVAFAVGQGRAATRRPANLSAPARLQFDGTRLPASYANFYIANGLVIVPTFNDPKDRLVLGILADLFPGREVIGIHCLDLVWGLGTLHCMTQQQPASDQ